MMRFYIQVVLLACMFATGNLSAQSTADDRETTTTQQPEPEPQQRRPPVKPSPQQPAQPAPTFKPSEKIGADSAVSFPVDI